MLEVAEGCGEGVTGLCDGAAAFAAALLSYGPGSDPYQAALQVRAKVCNVGEGHKCVRCEGRSVVVLLQLRA